MFVFEGIYKNDIWGICDESYAICCLFDHIAYRGRGFCGCGFCRWAVSKNWGQINGFHI